MKRILVCMKAVPVSVDSAGDAGQIQRERASLQWNLADTSALEAALRLWQPEDRVTVLSMGPAKLERSLAELLGRGADQAVRITDRAFAGSDTRATAGVLAAAVEKLGGFDWIFCGNRTMDGETGQVPGELAAALDLPFIGNCQSVQRAGERLFLERRLETGVETLQTGSALVSLCPYTYPLRLPSILALRRVREQAVKVLTAVDLPPMPSPTRVLRAERRLPGKRNGPKIDDQQVGLDRLREMLREAKP